MALDAGAWLYRNLLDTFLFTVGAVLRGFRCRVSVHLDQSSPCREKRRCFPGGRFGKRVRHQTRHQISPTVFRLAMGADATVAAEPVRRHAAAGTDLKLNAEILSYSRSKGAFAGVSVDGSVVQADKSGDKAMYGAGVTRREIPGRQDCGS